jgi:hypothetical protein
VGKGGSRLGRALSRGLLATLLQGLIIVSLLLPYSLPVASAQPSSTVGTIQPARYPLLFGSSGNIEIDIPKPGIAVRIEIPREFLKLGGVQISENDTSFVTSNIRNDYYYYNLVDESRHYDYNWRDNATDGPCFKPDFSYYDLNAPYCLEIWNFLNYPNFTQPQYNTTVTSPATFDYNDTVGVDYCESNATYTNANKFVFGCFSAPKFVLLHNLASPTLAGLYNFTLSVANRTNIFGRPDFVHAWSTTLFVPVSAAYNAGYIAGNVCDAGSVAMGLSCNSVTGPIRGKGVVYALSSGKIVARAYLNQSLCQASGANCGRFNLTGLAPGNYQIEGSAGVDRGVAYSLTICCSGGPPSPPSTIYVPPNGHPGATTLPLRRSPLVCGTISYQSSGGGGINSLSGNTALMAAGYARPGFNLNVTVEGSDSNGHTFRFEGVSSNTPSDTFNLTTGVGVKYVGTDPYGTEFAGLPAPEDSGSGGYSLTVNVWVSGYVQQGGFSVVQLLQSPGTGTPSCSPPNQPTVSIIMRAGGLISGTLVFQTSDQTPEPPFNATAAILGIGTNQSLFGGNVVIQAYDQFGILRGLTVINGTLPDGQAGYASCGYSDTCATVPFTIVGFSEYYNHSLSGIWDEHDYGLPIGTYTLSVSVRGYEQTQTDPASVSITSGGSNTVTVHMTRGGAFEVTVSSFDNRFGTRAPQACLPWRFVDSTIPVRARVYFFGPGGTVGYVEVLMLTKQNLTLTGVLSFGFCTFQVIFAGQNWHLQQIWFYGDVPSYVTNATYNIQAFTLGYVEQFPSGISTTNLLVGFSQNALTLFVGNEIDETVPIFSDPLSLSNTPEADYAIGETFSGPLFGAEMTNMTAHVPSLNFTIFGFGGMQLSDKTECHTTEFSTSNSSLTQALDMCGQGHFFYIGTDGTLYYDYGLDMGNYTAQVPEFGFNFHFLDVTPSPTISFTDLFLQLGTVLQAIQMATVMQGPGAAVLGWTDPPFDAARLSWAQVQATSPTFTRSVSTADGNYTGVDALFLPAGVYNFTFSDVPNTPGVGYQTSPPIILTIGWGNSYSLVPGQPLCPTGAISC